MSVFDPLKREPAWLVHKVDQRIAFMQEKVGGIAEMASIAGMTMVMSFLTEPEGETEAEFQLWNQSCDNCGMLCTAGPHPGHVIRVVDDVQVVITFGMCTACKEAK